MTHERGRLSARDRIVFDTLLPAVGDPTLPDGVLTAGLPGTFAEFHGAADARMRASVRLALLAATWIAPLLIHRVPPIGRHERAVRELALEAMAGSRHLVLRQLLVLLKILAGMAYGSSPEVRERLGYGRGRVM